MKVRHVVALALLACGTIAATDPPSNGELETMYDRAYRAFDQADYPQALKELDAIEAREPDLAASKNLRGAIYIRQGRYDEAEAVLNEALRLDPKFWNARFNLAEVPFLKKDWAEARKRFQQLLNGNAGELKSDATQLIQYEIVLTHLLQGNDAAADSALNKSELAPNTAAFDYANAAIALKKQNGPEARKWLSLAEKNFPPQINKLFSDSLFNAGLVQQEPGRTRTALQALTAEEPASGNKAGAQSLAEQSEQAFEARDFDRAAKLAEQADADLPDHAPILNLRGEIALEQQRYDEAEKFFTRAAKIDPKFRQAEFNLAEVPFRQKQYGTARERFQTLLKETPGGDKNQAAQFINFKIFMSYLLDGKESRAQKLMEQLQFTGDTPAFYFAQAAWEFQHGRPEKGNDWIASARKIYPAGANAAYTPVFYDMGWLKNNAGGSSPAPSAAASAAVAQDEAPSPVVEPSAIPGAQAKNEENTFVSAQREQTPPASPSVAPSATASPSPSATAALAASVAAEGTASPAQTAPVPPVQATTAAIVAHQSLAPAASVSTTAGATSLGTPTATVAPSAVAAVGQSLPPKVAELLGQLADWHTFLWVIPLIGGLLLLTWVVIHEIRRRLHPAHVDHHSAPATRRDLPATKTARVSGNAAHRFSGGPRRVTVQLKPAEPIARRPTVPLAPRQDVHQAPSQTAYLSTHVETPIERQTIPEPPPEEFAAATEREIGNGDREVAAEAEEPEPPSGVSEQSEGRFGEPSESVPAGPQLPEENSEEVATAFYRPESEPDEAVEHEAVEQNGSASSPEMLAAFSDEQSGAAAPGTSADFTQEISPPRAPVESSEPVGQGQPVPFQTPAADVASVEETQPSTEAELLGLSGALAGVAALRKLSEAIHSREEEFNSQPNNTHTMPETVQTPPAPITHPPVTPAPPAPAAPTPPAAATRIHAAVQITLSCEIASMQLTPNFKMGALQLRPVSKLVTMGLLSAPSGQSGMNLHAAFEIDRIEPAQGSLGRIRLTPAQQGQQQQQEGQQGGSRTAPSFNISGLQVVAASEAAPLQLTPSQQGQTSVRLTAMCHISAVEFSPTFDIGAMVLNATSNTVSVQLPGAAAQMENGPVFEIANVQVNNDGDITMLQLNPAGSRRG